VRYKIIDSIYINIKRVIDKILGFPPKLQITLIILFALILLLWDINEPWIGLHDWNGASYGQMGVNHLKYGYDTTGGIPIWGILDGKIKWVLRHPPGLPLMLSFSFAIFGIYEWSARLIPIAFSLASVYILYLIVRELWDEKHAVIAAFFTVLIPMYAYYGRMVCPEICVLFFALLIIYLYIKLFDTNKLRYLFIMIIAVFVGGLVDYPTFFIILPLLIYGLIFKNWSKRLYVCIVLIITAILTFAFFIWWATTMAGTLEPLWAAYAQRSDRSYLLREMFYWRLFEWMLIEFTFIIVFLTLVWVWKDLCGLIIRNRQKILFVNTEDNQYICRTIFIFILFLYGITYLIVFPQTSFIHDHSMYFLIPFFAVASTAGLKYISKSLRVFAIGLILILSISATAYLHVHWDRPELYEIGVELKHQTAKDDIILVGNPVIGWYTERTYFYLPRNSTVLEEIVIEYKPKFIVYGAYWYDPKYSMEIESVLEKNYTLHYKDGYYIWEKNAGKEK
jgi:4-amino-4-deoxy-L-arabinose transferase-like glycosyltransferase